MGHNSQRILLIASSSTPVLQSGSSTLLCSVNGYIKDKLSRCGAIIVRNKKDTEDENVEK